MRALCTLIRLSESPGSPRRQYARLERGAALSVGRMTREEKKRGCKTSAFFEPFLCFICPSSCSPLAGPLLVLAGCATGSSEWPAWGDSSHAMDLLILCRGQNGLLMPPQTFLCGGPEIRGYEAFFGYEILVDLEICHVNVGPTGCRSRAS